MTPTETMTLPVDSESASSTLDLICRKMALTNGIISYGGDSKKEVVVKQSTTIDDYSETDINKAIENVLRTSIYSGNARDLMINAISDTVYGKMSLTQAAAKFNIPFSTIHPYVKKLRQCLGLSEPIPELKKQRAPVRRKGKDESGDEVVQAKKQRKKRSPPPGYVPFKQIVIPDHWKQFPQKMQDAVWTAVAFCNYDNVEKKHRLCQAIMDVMIGQKTLKAAASNNNIPFTTLQTYFHRSRITMERCMENDEEVQRAKLQSESANNSKNASASPTSNASGNANENETLAWLASFMFGNNEGGDKKAIENGDDASTIECSNDVFRTGSSTPSSERSNGKSVDAVTEKLLSKRLNQPIAGVNGLDALKKDSFGSRKRKPQVVKRVSPVDEDQLSDKAKNGDSGQLWQFLHKRFGLQQDDSRPTDNAADQIYCNEVAALHYPPTVNSEQNLVKALVQFFCKRWPDIDFKNAPDATTLVRAVLDESISVPDSFKSHVKTIKKAYIVISTLYPLFVFKVTPVVSNLATAKETASEKKLFHGILRENPPATLEAVVTPALQKCIVNYARQLIKAGIPLSKDLTRFLIEIVIRDRTLSSLYAANEFENLHKQIVSQIGITGNCNNA